MEKLEESLDEEVFLLLSKTRPPKFGHEGKLVFILLELGVRRGCPCGFFTSWPSASPRWTCLRSGGQESCPETQKAVVQWSGPALGAAMSKHRPFHQDFFHPRPVPLPCKGQMWGIQSPFSSNDFSNVHNSLWSNWTYSADFPSVPWSYEHFDFVWIMSHSWWRQWKKEGTKSE